VERGLGSLEEVTDGINLGEEIRRKPTQLSAADASVGEVVPSGLALP